MIRFIWFIWKYKVKTVRGHIHVIMKSPLRMKNPKFLTDMDNFAFIEIAVQCSGVTVTDTSTIFQQFSWCFTSDDKYFETIFLRLAICHKVRASVGSHPLYITKGGGRGHTCWFSLFIICTTLSINWEDWEELLGEKISIVVALELKLKTFSLQILFLFWFYNEIV